jgi:uncharacterized protein (TIGR02722 family)
MRSLILPLALCLFPPLFTACSSLEYEDPQATETVTIDFGTGDLQNLAAAMVDSMVQSPKLRAVETGDGTGIVKVALAGVENRTSEHIDTSGITDEIRVRLLASDYFAFVAVDKAQEAIAEQVRFQQGSGRVDPDTAKAFGRQIGADVVLYGTLRSIEKDRGRSLGSGGSKTELLDFQFVLTAADLTTGLEIWAESKYIRKLERTGLFGR